MLTFASFSLEPEGMNFLLPYLWGCTLMPFIAPHRTDFKRSEIEHGSLIVW